MGRNILQEIAASKRREVEAMKRVIAPELLVDMVGSRAYKPLDMKLHLRDCEPAIIAEHKRRSPSKGEISPMSDVGSVARMYAEKGAAAMSVLTDTPYFGGSLEDLAVACMAAPSLPLLRKEFIVDAYQLYQALLYGADAVLLIAAMLPPEEILTLNDTAHALGLQTLVELHNAAELASLPSDADMVGVNSRDLTSFHTDLSNALRLIDALPPGMVKVAESGIRTPEDMARLRREGFDAFLIGETFMSTSDPGERLEEFCQTHRCGSN